MSDHSSPAPVVETALKPCPFCGEEVDGVSDANEAVAHIPSYYVACHRCDIGTVGYREMGEAVAVWNQRASGVSVSATATDAAIERVLFVASVLENAGRDANGEVPEWLRPGWLAEDVAPMIRKLAAMMTEQQSEIRGSGGGDSQLPMARDGKYCKARNGEMWCTAEANHEGQTHVVHHLDGTPNVVWSVPDTKSTRVATETDEGKTKNDQQQEPDLPVESA